MSRFIAILFLSLHLLTSTQLCQLVKLPLLFEHYAEHENWSQGISFITFLRMHYFNGDPKDFDYDRDMQLPFKTDAGALLICQCHSFPMPSSQAVPAQPVVEIPHYYNNYSSTRMPSARLNDIFQPPRLS